MEGQESQRWLRILTPVLVTTMAILVVVVMVPLLQSPRGPRRNLQSINNLKNLALAVHNYAVAHGGTLPQTAANPEVPLSWRTHLLQYLDRADLHRGYDSSSEWNGGKNAEISRLWLSVFDSPEGDFRGLTIEGWGVSDYGMVSGPGTVQPDEGVVTLDEISKGDGLGQTLLIVECAGLKLAWAEPRDPRVDREEIRIENLTRSGETSKALVSSFNPDRAAVAFADGSARSLSNKIDQKVLAALCTVNGGEEISREDYLR